MSIDPLATRCQWIANKLHETRIKRGLTLMQVAHRMGWAGHAQVSDYESCKYVPNLETFLSLLEAVNTTACDFFADMPAIKEVGGPLRSRIRHKSERKIGARAKSAKKRIKENEGATVIGPRTKKVAKKS